MCASKLARFLLTAMVVAVVFHASARADVRETLRVRSVLGSDGGGVSQLTTVPLILECASVNTGSGVLGNLGLGTVVQTPVGTASGGGWVMDVGFLGCLDGVVGLCGVDNDCNDGQLCSVDLCGGLLCRQETLIYGDINRDGFVNVVDALCLLDTFAGIPDSAACIDPSDGHIVGVAQKDISPCPSTGDPARTGDGFVNVGDVLTVLDAFSCNCSSLDVMGCMACGVTDRCPACSGSRSGGR